MAFKILILICSISLDHAACQPETAIDVIQGPKVASEMQCGLMAQTTIAGNGAALAPQPGEYMKIICRHFAKTAEIPF